MSLELIITMVVGASVPVGALVFMLVMSRKIEREASKRVRGH